MSHYPKNERFHNWGQVAAAKGKSIFDQTLLPPADMIISLAMNKS
jgi:hypothetical protein